MGRTVHLSMPSILTTTHDLYTAPAHLIIYPSIYPSIHPSLRYVLEYEVTPSEEYFAPHFVVTEDGDMLWPLSSDSAQRQEALGRMSTEKHTVVANPFFAVYPAQNNPNETAFNKYYQCQKRLFFGPPNLFDSCFDTLYTGRDTLSKILSIKALHGNESVYEYSNGTAVQGSVANNQYEPHLWSGFNAYPYSYLGQTAGANYKSMVAPEIYNKYHAIRYKLFQKTLLFEFQRDIELSMPPPTGPTDYPSPSQSINLRRFVEDFDSWKEYRALGSPVDSVGMPHKIPIGMSSLQRFADFPVYLGARLCCIIKSHLLSYLCPIDDLMSCLCPIDDLMSCLCPIDDLLSLMIRDPQLVR